MRLAVVAMLVACGASHHDATPEPDANVPIADGAIGPRRLTIAGTQLLDGTLPVTLRGANLRDNLVGDSGTADLITDVEADDLATSLHLDFVRLRISFEGINRDDSDPTNLSADLRQKLDDGVARLANRHVWILLEMRTSDAVANTAALYMPGSPDFVAYQKAWTYLGGHYANVDYIAGYGILAEPSPDKALADDQVVAQLVTFQRALMDSIDQVDHGTPFFIGPAFNYDTMGYRWDDYATAFPAYTGRLIYEVNLLMPKPWIDSGIDENGTAVTYPIDPPSTPDQLTATLLAPTQGLTLPIDNERIFSKQRVPYFGMLMSNSFLGWYLDFAHQFAVRHSVPMVVDQFGAATTSNGQLTYERDVIETAEADGMGWCRWLYGTDSASQQPRDIEHNAAVHAFYSGL